MTSPFTAAVDASTEWLDEDDSLLGKGVWLMGAPVEYGLSKLPASALVEEELGRAAASPETPRSR